MADKQAYNTWTEGDNAGMAKAMAGVSNALSKIEMQRSVASDIYFNVAPNNTSVRDGYNRSDYDDFRPSERLPTKPKDIIRASISAYRDFGLVHNIIDLMGDFTVQGIDVVHTNKRIERFYKDWFSRVNGRERSERFANLLYGMANVIVKRQTAKIPIRLQKEMERAISADIDLSEKPRIEKREIPWKYSFLNPLSLELIGEEIAPFLGSEHFMFGVSIPDSLATIIKYPKGKQKELLKHLSPDIRQAIQSGSKLIILDPSKVRAFYYKRNDWEAWATPMLNSILYDLNMLNKMKLADMSALDGAISNIRIWKLGNLDAKIMPSEATILRLASMLNNNVGGGVMDLVWGPDIELKETSTEVHKFLGMTKYESVLSFIYQGLGIPTALSGQTKGGFTSDFLSLKTLIERLQYGRMVITSFWNHELSLVQKAMNFRTPATLTFDRMTLNDEASERRLLLSLYDRVGISLESLQERFGETPEIEELRIRREERARDSGKVPRRASPFHDPMVEWGIKKILAQSGAYAPSEFGIELEERETDEEPPVEVRSRLDLTQTTVKGEPGQGRPVGAKDSFKRKQKVIKPKASAAFVEALDYAARARASINSLIAPSYLKSLGKKTARELTVDEEKQFEDLKFSVLCRMELGQQVNAKVVGSILKEPKPVNFGVRELLKASLAKFIETNGKEPPLEVLRRFQASVYALYKGDYCEASDTDDGLQKISRTSEESEFVMEQNC